MVMYPFYSQLELFKHKLAQEAFSQAGVLWYRSEYSLAGTYDCINIAAVLRHRAGLPQAGADSMTNTWMSHIDKNDPTGEGTGNPVKSMNSREAQVVRTSENPGTYSGF